MKKRIFIAAMAAAAGLGMSVPAGAGAGQQSNAEAIADLPEELQSDGALPEEKSTEETKTGADDAQQMHRIRFAADYEEVFEELLKVTHYYYLDEDYLDDDIATAYDGIASAVAVAETSDEAAADSAKDFSTTNLRDAGVDEADIVKTDGTYIYILRDGAELVIRSVSGTDVQTVSVTDVSGEARGEAFSYISGGAEDMYLDGDRLILLSSEYVYDTDQEGFCDSRAVISTYDISNRAAPKLLGSAWQDGYYRQSRKIGNTVYIYTTLYPDVRVSFEDSRIIPFVNGKELEASRIAIPDLVTSAAYLLVSSVNIETPGLVTDSLALLSGADSFYVSPTSLYVMNEKYERSTYRTEIVKFTCADGMLSGRGAIYLKGSVNDSFSIDEYNGYLRVLTTYTGSDRGALLEAISDFFGFYYYDEDRWLRHNALYILDEDLNRVGSIKDLAEGEEIRSARFFGDTAYFVTFRNTDPLFSADLSDPANPQILGELSVTGFSSYLHPYGDGLLLGIGYEADPDTGWTTGIKLSMFDISDPANVTELDRYIISGPTDAPAISDYKAILADPAKNVIGFFFDNRYLVCSYSRENGFTKELLYDFYADSIGGSAYNRMRGLYIGNELYLAGWDYLVAFNMAAGYEKDLVYLEKMN